MTNILELVNKSLSLVEKRAQRSLSIRDNRCWTFEEAILLLEDRRIAIVNPYGYYTNLILVCLYRLYLEFYVRTSVLDVIRVQPDDLRHMKISYHSRAAHCSSSRSLSSMIAR